MRYSTDICNYQQTRFHKQIRPWFGLVRTETPAFCRIKEQLFGPIHGPLELSHLKVWSEPNRKVRCRCKSTKNQKYIQQYLCFIGLRYMEWIHEPIWWLQRIQTKMANCHRGMIPKGPQKLSEQYLQSSVNAVSDVTITIYFYSPWIKHSERWRHPHSSAFPRNPFTQADGAQR